MSLLTALDAIRARIRAGRWPSERAAAVRGEDLAMRFLERRKYVIVARNYRPRAGFGEIDLVGWDRETLVFIEVKTRTSDDTGSPERAVDREKRRHLERTARDYARRANVAFDCVRFDVVSILGLDPPRIELFRDAFTPEALTPADH